MILNCPLYFEICVHMLEHYLEVLMGFLLINPNAAVGSFGLYKMTPETLAQGYSSESTVISRV